ncbi:MAG: UrcA family protein [Sphingomonas sp.]|jgi:UrcA family protein
MSTIFFRTTFLLGLCLVTTPAMAEQDVERAIVRTGDLNLATAAGERALNRRIEQAATLVCGRPDPYDIAMSAPVRACRNRAIKRVMPQIDLAIAGARNARSYAMENALVAPGAR